MRHKAFTLVELLVVVGIIAVLVMILVPQLTTARDMGRRTTCRHNLRQIGAAFGGASTDQKRIIDAAAFPDANRWPAIPYEYAPNDRIYLCPEDNPGNWDVISGLEYVSGYSPNPVYPFADGYVGPGGKVVTRGRRGSDSVGPYWEYVHEEAYTYEHGCEFWDQRTWYPSGPDYSDNDGVFRIYDNIPGRGRIVKLHEYNCYAGNTATLFGKGLFNPAGTLQGLKGSEAPLKAFYTSYGINARAHAVEVRPDTAVLMDFRHTDDDMSFIADPSRANINARLDLSGRHLGRMNVLFADGSVRSVYPAQMYPTANGAVWSP